LILVAQAFLFTPGRVLCAVSALLRLGMSDHFLVLLQTATASEGGRYNGKILTENCSALRQSRTD
jgi:hypothetical protein